LVHRHGFFRRILGEDGPAARARGWRRGSFGWVQAGKGGQVEGRAGISYSGQDFSLRGEKNRFVLPPQFRKTVKESSDGRILCLDKHDRWPCLTGFGLSRKGDFAAQLDREEALYGREFDRDLRATQLYGFAEVPFDDSGRFIMPEHLVDLGKVGDGLFFSAGTFFTIWNKAELDKMGVGWEAAKAACAKLSADAHAKAAKK
jgi:MraZ protein